MSVLAAASSDTHELEMIGLLLLAFVLSTLIGLERRLRGRNAGLRTQAIVGTSSALFILVSKYGFFDVLGDEVSFDPSRVAAGIVSGIGFLGAGLILTRRNTVLGLTTAASVWETAAIGTAAGAGLWLLAIVVTALHFVITYGLRALSRLLPGGDARVHISVVYDDGHGLLRVILAALTDQGWSVQESGQQADAGEGRTGLQMGLTGRHSPGDLVTVLSGIEGVRSVRVLSEEDDD
ncbi:MgtC/SapB family protein [Corynebacterium nuruki]|uniref:MgtC/SapB transporter n=1 Tax=Corynebacterium nuruki TaxID=1032851 RepID=A0A3D4SXN1_9CORY|nr:MgtC/SapB family protein [Corynebacterium nuruki]HCT14044.1 MgtC/SapB transporter [Corynebacterium nuruki]